MTEGAGSYETRPREQTAACINQREMLMTESPGKEATQELTAGEQGLRYTGIGVMAGVGSKREVLSGPESGVGMGTTSGYTASGSPRRAHFFNLAVPDFRPFPGSNSRSTEKPVEQGLRSQSSEEQQWNRCPAM